MTLRIDIIDGSRAKEDEQGWLELERIATVDGLTGDGQAKFSSAMNAPGMPAMSDAHPIDPTLVLMERTWTSPGPDLAKATLLYKRRLQDSTNMNPPGAYGIPQPSLEVGTTLSQIEANLDAHGAKVKVSYTGTKRVVGVDQDDQLATFPKQVPQTSLSYKRHELGSPISKSRTYVGRVNAAGWNVDPGNAAGVWLCTGITGTSTDGNRTYDVTYTFSHCGDTPTGTWQGKAYWRSSNGLVPDDLVGGTGIVDFDNYSEIDFSGLHL